MDETRRVGDTVLNKTSYVMHMVITDIMGTRTTACDDLKVYIV